MAQNRLYRAEFHPSLQLASFNLRRATASVTWGAKLAVAPRAASCDGERMEGGKLMQGQAELRSFPISRIAPRDLHLATGSSQMVGGAAASPRADGLTSRAADTGCLADGRTSCATGTD